MRWRPPFPRSTRSIPSFQQRKRRKPRSISLYSAPGWPGTASRRFRKTDSGSELNLTRAPALMVRLTSVARIWHGRDFDADLALLVALDRGLPGPAVLLAPDQGEHIAFVDVRVDDAQRQAAAFVVAVAGEHRQTDHLAAHGHAVVGRRGIIRDRQIEKLVPLATAIAQRREHFAQVFAIP